MDGATVVAIASTSVAAIGAGATALWKLATMIAEVRAIVTGELHHNGGGSTKDYAREAAEEAKGARRAADLAHWRIDAIDREMILLRGVRSGHASAMGQKLIESTDEGGTPNE